ncbi:MAG: hypothetical protein MPJ22_05620 [Pirellulales bacterium]|nr:hypothetical protein [Alphaproteobacteria bacterium]MDA8041881.1 hypothetical protein [Pirellulales bacterium]
MYFLHFPYEKIIGQLDLALDQLAHHDEDLDRFALMLVDNAVEIALHKHAWGNAPINSWPEPGQKGNQGDFRKKVQLAKTTGIISLETEESINFLHELRNSSYHRGRSYKRVIHSLTIFYFKVACKLLQDHRPLFISTSSELPYRAAKYLGDVALPAPLPYPEQLSAAKKYFGVAWERLIKAADALRSDLRNDLVQDMTKTIYDAHEMIEFLAGRPSKENRKEAVKDVMAECFAWSPEAKECAVELGFAKPGEDFEPLKFAVFLMTKDKFPGSHDPIPQWKTRLNSLKNKQNDQNAAVKKYFTFMEDTEKTRANLSNLYEPAYESLRANAQKN